MASAAVTTGVATTINKNNSNNNDNRNTTVSGVRTQRGSALLPLFFDRKATRATAWKLFGSKLTCLRAVNAPPWGRRCSRCRPLVRRLLLTHWSEVLGFIPRWKWVKPKSFSRNRSSARSWGLIAALYFKLIKTQGLRRARWMNTLLRWPQGRQWSAVFPLQCDSFSRQRIWTSPLISSISYFWSHVKLHPNITVCSTCPTVAPTTARLETGAAELMNAAAQIEANTRWVFGSFPFVWYQIIHMMRHAK